MFKYNVNRFQFAVLKKVKKYPNGVSKEKLIHDLHLGKNNGIDSILSELVIDGFLERTESENDKARRVMNLPVTEFTGDYVPTDKAYACLTNWNYEVFVRVVIGCASYIAGILSTLICQHFAK